MQGIGIVVSSSCSLSGIANTALDDVPFAVVVVTTNGALVRFDPGIYVELEVPHQVYALVKHFVTMQALQVKVFVLVHVVLEPVLMREPCPGAGIRPSATASTNPLKARERSSLS